MMLVSTLPQLTKICNMIEDMETPSYILDNTYMHNSNNNNFDIADFLCESGVHPGESRDQCSLSEDSCNRSDCTEGYYGYQSNGEYIDTPGEYCPENVPYDDESMKYTVNCNAERSVGVEEDGKVKAITGRPEHNVQPSQRPGCPGRSVKMEDNPEFLRWTSRHPENWSPQEVLDWLFFAAEKHNLDCTNLRAENFRSVAGADLCKMNMDDFMRHEPNYGKLFYDMFRNLCDGLNFSQPTDNHPQDCIEYDDVGIRTSPVRPILHNMNSDPGPMSQSYATVPDISCKPDLKMEHMPDHVMNDHMMYDIQHLAKYNYQSMPMTHLLQAPSMKHHPFHPHPHHMSPYDQYPPHCMYSDFGAMHRMPPPPCHIPDDHMVPQPIRRRPGRPRIKSLPTEEEAAREKKAKNQHLWEFIYEILMNPLYNPQYLRWENQREGVFRFVQSEAVAQLWGGLKNNENMTYEKLSRAMRHYYKRGILERVEGRRLVYKFSRIAMERVREKRYSV